MAQRGVHGSARSSARPTSRARIETRNAAAGPLSMVAAPGQPAGRGLKRSRKGWAYRHDAAAPGQPAGRGLKHDYYAGADCLTKGSARPTSRARIETLDEDEIDAELEGSARPTSRARIETQGQRYLMELNLAAPGQPAGRGLKHGVKVHVLLMLNAAPGQPAGRGLKRVALQVQRKTLGQRPANQPGED